MFNLDRMTGDVSKKKKGYGYKTKNHPVMCEGPNLVHQVKKIKKIKTQSEHVTCGYEFSLTLLDLLIDLEWRSLHPDFLFLGLWWPFKGHCSVDCWVTCLGFCLLSDWVHDVEAAETPAESHPGWRLRCRWTLKSAFALTSQLYYHCS